MQALLKTGAGLERRLTIKLPIAPIEREYAAQLRSLKLRSDTSLQRDSHKALRDRIIMGVKHTSFLEAASQHKLSAIGSPCFGSATEEDGVLAFSVNFAVLPNIDTSSYGDIQINRPIAELTGQDIDAVMHAHYSSTLCENPQPRADIKEQLEYQLAEATRQAIKPQLIEALLAKHVFTPPEAMVTTEFEHRMQGWRQKKASNPTLQIPAETQVRFNSSRAVSLGIIFTEIIQSAKIVPDEAHIHQAIEHIANASNNPEEVIKRYNNNEALLAQVEETGKIDMAIDWVAVQASVTDIPSPFSQLVGNPRLRIHSHNRP